MSLPGYSFIDKLPAKQQAIESAKQCAKVRPDKAWFIFYSKARGWSTTDAPLSLSVGCAFEKVTEAIK